MDEIAWTDFVAVEMRSGTILSAAVFPEALKPAYLLEVDFGAELGIRRSSAQITDLYTPEQLVGRQVIAVLNLPPKQIGPHRSHCLVMGLPREDGAVVLASLEQRVPDGTRLA